MVFISFVFINFRKKLIISKFLILLIFIFSCLVLARYNYLKWGSPTTFAPMQFHEQLIGNDRGKKIESLPNLSFGRLIYSVDYYLIPTYNAFIKNKYGYIYKDNWLSDVDYKKFDYIESKYTIILMLPILCFFCFRGFFYFYRSLNFSNIFKLKFDPLTLLVISSSIPFVFILLVHSLALRYRGDMYPLLIVLGSVGIGSIIKPKNFIKNLFGCIVLLVISFGFAFQSIIVERQLSGIFSENEILPITWINFIK